MQKKDLPGTVVMLKATMRNRQPAWVFAPQGWNAAELERSLGLRRRSQGGGLCAVLTVSQVRELMRRYGGRPRVQLAGSSSLDRLLGNDVKAVELTIFRLQDRVSTMPL